MNEQAALAIIRYTDEYLFEPGLNWPKLEFKRRAYSRWAAEELLDLVLAYPNTPEDKLVEMFLWKMNIFATLTDNRESPLLFSSARDTAEDILHHLKGEPSE